MDLEWLNIPDFLLEGNKELQVLRRIYLLFQHQRHHPLLVYGLEGKETINLCNHAWPSAKIKGSPIFVVFGHTLNVDSGNQTCLYHSFTYVDTVRVQTQIQIVGCLIQSITMFNPGFAPAEFYNRGDRFWQKAIKRMRLLLEEAIAAKG